jgi:RNA polymerase sigma-70 factor (ECF subfamily)
VPAAEAPELPRRLRRHADEIVFLERLEPSGELAEDRETAHLVNRFQAGDQDAYAQIYMRYFDRVYAYMRVMLRSQHEAEDATQEVFIRVFDRLPTQALHRPFRAWLMTVVRNHAIDVLRRSHRIQLEEDPAAEARNGDDEDGLPAGLDWITDRDLLVLFERLPLAQRQVLLLRYLLDLSAGETASILGRTPEDVRALQYRAFSFIRARLAAAGRKGPSRDRARARTYTKQALVLRRRRFALVPR